MAGISGFGRQNLTSSVAAARRKLLQMLDVIAESGMRHAHREISRGKMTAPPTCKPSKKAKPAGKNIGVH